MAVNFDFNIDSAWQEVMYLWKMVKDWTFSFTTYNISFASGSLVTQSVTHTIKILDFLCALLVMVTLDDVLFWWNNAYRFGSGISDYEFDDD